MTADGPSERPVAPGVPGEGGEPTTAHAPNLTRQTLSGLRWTYLGTVVGLVLQLVYSAVMGRLLTPREFGLVASAQVVLRLGRYIAELGLGPALIQRERLTTDEVRAGFTSSVLLGGALTAGLLLAAPLLEDLFDDPAVVPVVRVLALTLFANALTIVSTSILIRELRFKEMAMVEIASFVVCYLGIGLVSALLGARVWSLVAAAVSQVLVLAVVSYLLVRHPVRPLLAFGKVRSLYTFGGKISFITLVEYATQATPTVVIGRYSGQAPLGQYNRAVLLIDLPLYSAAYALSKVLFPAISRVQGDVARVRQAYLTAVRSTAALVVPAAAGAAVAAPQLVELVLGPQWDPAAAIVPPLALAASLGLLAHYGGIVCDALNALNAKMVFVTVLLALTIAGLLAVPAGDLVAYGYALAGIQLVTAVGYAWFMSRLLKITWRQQAGCYLPSVVAGTAAAAAIWGVTRGAVALGTPLPLVVVVQVLTGIAVLLLMIWYGPLRPVRADALDRLRNAGLSPEDSPAMSRVFRVLQVGRPRRVG